MYRQIAGSTLRVAAVCFHLFAQYTGVGMMQSLFPLGWEHYLLGGLLIGTGVSLLYLLTGWVGGMSTVFSSTWSYVSQKPFFQQSRFVDTRLHLGPRHLRPGLVTVAFPGGGSDLYGHGFRHSQRRSVPGSTRMTSKQFLAVLASGALFGFGLAVSTMVSPEVVLSFLRFQDFGLMLVMGGAVCV